MNIDLTQIILTLLSGGGILGVWLSSRASLRQTKQQIEESGHKMLEERSRQLFEQFRASNAEDRAEFARQRTEWAAERERILQKLNACEEARDKDVEERATLKAEIAYMRGKIDWLTNAGPEPKQTP